MNLHEYQSKRVFAQFGIPVPKGEVATTPAEVRDIAVRLGTPVVVKSQVLVGGRGKAGGIKLARSLEEAEKHADAILGMTIKGLKVRKVLVDPAANIAKEIYLGAVLDRANRRVVMMASSEGGVDIEEVAATAPEKIVKVGGAPVPGPARPPGPQPGRWHRHSQGPDQGLYQDRTGALPGVCQRGRQPGRDQPTRDHGRQQADGAGR